jgi:hypothetical protein
MKPNVYQASISLKEVTEKFRKGITQGLYGPSYSLRMLQFNPTIISIAEDQFQFVMFKHHGVFHAQISSEIAAHWGIKPRVKKNCL